MTIYGIGRAIVDYYVKGKTDKDFIEEAFNQLPEKVRPSAKGLPLHIDGRVFSLILKTIGTLKNLTLLKATGGTCVNILKTIAQLDSHAICIFSGTVGKNSSLQAPKTTLSSLESDDDGLFFNKSLEKQRIHTNLKVLDGTTGRCLILSGESTISNKTPQQRGSAYLALASPEVSSKITEEQILFPENLQYTLVEGMELDKPWFRQRLFLVPSALIIACGTPYGAKNTAVFLKEWSQQYQKSSVLSSLNIQQGEKLDIDSSLNIQQVNSTYFPLLILANDLEARNLEQGGINLLEWSTKRNILFVITHGCGGSSCYFHGTRLFTPATTVPDELVVDATGAGDVFAGAFIVHLHKLFLEKNLTLQKIQATLEQASIVASKIIQVPLCQTDIL